MKKSLLLLISIFCLAFLLRVYNLNWDQSFHLHPDERAIVMFTTPLEIPRDFSQFLSPQSPLNPHFFAYGSFPLYLLKIIGEIAKIFNLLYASYEKINLLGRFLSALFDVGTLTFVFLLSKKLFNTKVAFFSTFFYTISVLPIQLSHFYAVDTSLTFFTILTLYLLINFYQKPTIKNAIFVGFFFGFALATKISATVLLISISLSIFIDFLLIFLKNPHKPKIWFPHIPKLMKKLFFEGFIILISTVIIFIFLEPYAILDFKEFFLQTLQQRQMTYNAFTFPYTLQYVGKTPYLYEIKNIFFFGLGPVLTMFSFLGIVLIHFKILIFRKSSTNFFNINKLLIILSFFWVYFLTVGNFAIGFMRYMLPLYPFFVIFAAYFINEILSIIKKTKYYYLLTFFIIFIVFVWPLSFIKIYNNPNTRVTASNWIYQNISSSKTVAVEHWDDQLPLGGSKYKTLTLNLYDPDNDQKWKIITQQLLDTDYIIIASNRLYTPLQKLTDCKKLPQGRCYKRTANYYQKLFNGKLGFKKVAEFANYPKIPILNTEINDQDADESFTVYDHPKIMIFEKRDSSKISNM